MKWLNNRKTILGGLLLSLLSAVSILDHALHADGGLWIPDEMYVSIGGFVGGLTGVALRIGVQKSGPNNGNPPV